MATTIQNTTEQPVLTYEQEMDQLREKLNGKPYCEGVRKLLPSLTKWQVRNVVNGRKEDPLVLKALRIYIQQQQADRENAERLLDQAQAELQKQVG